MNKKYLNFGCIQIFTLIIIEIDTNKQKIFQSQFFLKILRLLVLLLFCYLIGKKFKNEGLRLNGK